ncbi:hypothetical protein, partial [Frankia sp. EI5c]|uniref:hypothetical protein n=1 Tax=Frankia sp. EI5c TaxID=683316 RepID=UPI001F5B1B62
MSGPFPARRGRRRLVSALAALSLAALVGPGAGTGRAAATEAPGGHPEPPSSTVST